MKIAYFSPLPPQRTGIADYSRDLLPSLAEHAALTLFMEQVDQVRGELSARFPVRPVSEFPVRRWDFDIALYQMGNSLFHETIYQTLQQFPGISVLHDYSLHHLIAGITAWRGDFARYIMEMGYAYGLTGLRLARGVHEGLWSYPLFEYPLNERCAALSLGVIVHSKYAWTKLQCRPEVTRVAQVNQPIPLPAQREGGRAALGLPTEAFIVGHFGQMTPEKRLQDVTEAFRRLLQVRPDARLLLVGEVPDWYEGLEQALAGLDEAVISVGYVPDLNTFYAYAAASDLCVNLRYPSLGETSASLLRVMAVGRPVIVSNVGWYTELPDDCCLKLDHDGTEVNTLARYLLELADAPEQRHAMGKCARSYVTEHCEPRAVAQAYVDFIEDCLSAL